MHAGRQRLNVRGGSRKMAALWLSQFADQVSALHHDRMPVNHQLPMANHSPIGQMFLGLHQMEKWNL